MKHLYLVRHAKSDWSDGTMTDFDRPLNERGKKDAPRMGEHLKTVRGVVLDGVLCSTAKRAKTTAKLMLNGMDFPFGNVVWHEEIYGGKTTDLLTLIQAVDGRCDALMVIGHNPDMTGLVGFLCGEEIEDMSTCAVCGMAFDVDSWEAISKSKGQRLFFDRPKNI